jgi:HK97 family phage portal protein
LSLFDKIFRRALEKRYNGFVADFSGSSVIPPNYELASYDSVNLRQAESSFQATAIWSAVNLIARLASSLPLDAFTGRGQDKREIRPPAWLEDPAGDGYGLADWTYQYFVSKLMRGNVYGRIASLDTLARPTQLVLYHPDDVSPYRGYDGVTWRVNGVEIPAGSMWHRRSFPMPGCLQGMSPIAQHATTIGLNITAQRFGADWFGHGAHPSALLARENEELDDDQAKVAKARFLAATRGTREPVVLGGGWTYQPIQVKPEESQFLETQKYTSADCARIYGPGMPEILGYETGGNLAYTNVEQRAIDLLKFTLDPWFKEFERDVSALLPRPQYVKLNRGALLATDILTRYRAHNMAIAGRYEAPSEARTIEDRQPLTPEQQAELDALNLPAPVMNPVKETEK